MALIAEAGELVEQFQWLTERESENLSPEKKENVADEIGDVLIYTLRLCSRIGIDPLRSARDKLKKNALRYPISLAKGNARKYSDLP
jgi:NTP pyrophosphatase (non-canonical NTP hydrolase)